MTVVGLVLGLLVVWMLWIALKNTVAYARMRKAEVVVAGSTLRVHGSERASGEFEPHWYSLQLALETVGEDKRQIVDEIDLDKAVYIEEALDELEYWKAGSRHQVRYLRGDAREVRLEGTSSPEVARAIAALFGAMMFAFPALAIVAGMSEEDGWIQRFRWGKSLGAWVVFLAVGVVCLLGALAFLVGYVVKAQTWVEVEAKMVVAERKFEDVVLPANVQMDAAAKKSLADQPYQLLEYELGGRKLHGGIGRGVRHGVLDNMTGESTGILQFRSDPIDRWEVSQDPLWGENFWVPFGAFGIFGLAFSGASLMVRRSEMRYR